GSVVGVIFLYAYPERQIVIGCVLGEVVLELKGVVKQQIVGREGLESKGGVGQTCLLDIDHREELPFRLATLVLSGVAEYQIIGHTVPDNRIPLANRRLDDLQHAII